MAKKTDSTETPAPPAALAAPGVTPDMLAVDFSAEALEARAAQVESDGLANTVPTGTIVNAEKGWVYFHFGTLGVHPDRLAQRRQELIDKQYQPVNGPLYKGGPRSEYAFGMAGREIWRTPQSVADRRMRARQQRAVRGQFWLKMQNLRRRRGGYVPDFVSDLQE